MRKVNFDPKTFPQEHCCLSIEEIKRRIQERFESIGDEDGCLPEGASRCELRIGTAQYKDGRQALVCVDLIPNYNTVTMSESIFDMGTGEWTEGDSSVEQRELHDMSQYTDFDRRRLPINLVHNISVSLARRVKSQVNAEDIPVGTMLVPDGREILVELSIKAEYAVSEEEIQNDQ